MKVTNIKWSYGSRLPQQASVNADATEISETLADMFGQHPIAFTCQGVRHTSPTYVLTYPIPYYGRHTHSLCGINTIRTVHIYTELKMNREHFSSLKGATERRDKLVSGYHDGYYHRPLTLPIDPERVNRELEVEDTRRIKEQDFTITIENI
jgi:hypothetical protein